MYKRILAALDGGRSTLLALEDALKLARAADTTVMVASVVGYLLPVCDPVLGISGTEASHVAAQKAAQEELDLARALRAARSARCNADYRCARGKRPKRDHAGSTSV